MRKIVRISLLFISLANCFAAAAQETLRLAVASVLQNNMVVQQNKPFKVWGYASPGDLITIKADWMKTPIKVMAEADHTFLGIIPVPIANKGDFTKHQLMITSSEQSITLTNLLIGDTSFFLFHINCYLI